MSGITIRYISLTELDSTIDTEEDFNNFFNKIGWIDELIIKTDRPTFENPILNEYNIKTITAYLYRFMIADIRCMLYDDKK